VVSQPLDPCPYRAFSRRVARVQVKGEQRTTRVNTAHPCYLDFFDVTVSWAGLRIRDEGSLQSRHQLSRVFAGLGRKVAPSII
jgi:hypothetical protein